MSEHTANGGRPVTEGRPLRVALVDDYPLVVAGLQEILAPFADRVVLVEPEDGAPLPGEVDLVLCDSVGPRRRARGDVPFLGQGQDDDGPPAVVFSWSARSALVDAALAAGARGYISKSVDGETLVPALERIAAGEVVVVQAPGEQAEDGTNGSWPGAEHGLTAREAEMLALLCQGLSNQEIAERAFIGENTVKTHLRVLFQKIGVDSRTRAALWGIDHRFRPDNPGGDRRSAANGVPNGVRKVAPDTDPDSDPDDDPDSEPVGDRD